MLEKNNGPVLYELTRVIYMALFITVRLTIHKDKKAVLLVDRDFKDREYISKLVENGIFDEVIYTRLRPWNSTFRDENKDANYAQISDFIEKYFDEQLYMNNYDIRDFSWIVTSSDHRDFEFDLYCNIKKKRYMFFEFIPNQFYNRKNRLYSSADPLPKGMRELFVKLNAFNGRSEYCFPFFNEKTTLFNNVDLHIKFYMKEEIKNIPLETGDKILKSYNYSWEQPDKDKPNVLFMVISSNSNFNSFKKNENYYKKYLVDHKKYKSHGYIYTIQTALDYLTDEGDRVFLKNHPSNPFTQKELKNNFGNDLALPDMPAQFYELAPEIQNFEFDTNITFDSVRYNVDIRTDNNFKLTLSFAKTIFIYNKLYFVIEILRDLIQHSTVKVAGIDAEHIIPLFHKKHYNTEVVSMKIIEDSATNEIIFSLNFPKLISVKPKILVVFESDEKPLLDGYETFEFNIFKKSLKEDGRVVTLEEEKFYIISKSGVLDFGNFEEEKKLYRTGISLTCKGVD